MRVEHLEKLANEAASRRQLPPPLQDDVPALESDSERLVRILDGVARNYHLETGRAPDAFFIGKHELNRLEAEAHPYRRLRTHFASPSGAHKAWRDGRGPYVTPTLVTVVLKFRGSDVHVTGHSTLGCGRARP